MKTVFGIVGMPASGKSTAIEIAKKYGEVIVMGDIVREETTRRGKPITGQTLGETAKQLRAEEGPAAVAIRCIEKIKALNSVIIFVDGLRSMEEVKLFRQHFKMIIIAVITSEKLRHQWLLSRKRADDGVSLQQIQERDAREIAFGIDQVIEKADFSINNLGTIEELQQNCKITFEKVKKISESS